MIEYAIVYMEVLILCIFFALIILFRTSGDLGTNMEVGIFKMLMRVYVVMLVFDIYTQLQYNDVISPPLITVAFGYSVYQFALGVLSTLWLIYAELQIRDAFPSRAFMIFVVTVPLVIMSILSFGSMWFNWFYSFDENGHFVRGPLFALMNVYAYLYFLITTVHAMMRYHTEKSLAKKRRMLLIASFIIPPTIGATLQLVIGGYPFLAPSICVAFLFIFVSIQSSQINVDALTGLNNRKSMENYVNGLMQDVSEDNPFYFFILDANNFKNINDTMGHVEGDQALRYIADGLRATADSFRGYICRYGGDEFVAVVNADQTDRPESFVTQLQASLQEICAEKELAYPLSVSAGFIKCTSPDTLIGTLVSEADKMLYAQKEIAHRASF